MAGDQPNPTAWPHRFIAWCGRTSERFDALTLSDLAGRLRALVAILSLAHFGIGLAVWLLLHGSALWLVLPGGFALAYLAFTLILRQLGHHYSSTRRLGDETLFSWGQRNAFLLALLILALVGVVYASLDDLLRSMHLPGTPAHGIDAAVNAFPTSSPVGRLREAVAGWADFMATTTLTAQRDLSIAWEHPLRLVFLLTFLDTLVIVPAYAILCGLALHLTERTIRPLRGQAADEGLHGAWGRSRRWLRLALAVALIADCLENLSIFLSTTAFVAQHRLATVPAYRAEIGDPVANLFSALAEPLLFLAALCTTLKVLGLLAFWVALGTYWLIILNAHRWPGLVDPATPRLGPRLWRLLLRVRLPLLVIALISLLLKVPQSNEIIRRWQTNLAEGFAALLATGLFALACGFYGWLATPEEAPLAEEDAPPFRPLLWFLLILPLMAAVPTALYQWQHGGLDIGHLIIGSIRAALPGLIILVLLPSLNALVVQQVLRARSKRKERQPRPQQAPRLAPLGLIVTPYFLGAAALAIVGLGAAQSATELLAYNALRGLFELRNLLLVIASGTLLVAALIVVANIPDLDDDSRQRSNLQRLAARSRTLTHPRSSWRRVGVGAGVATLAAWLLLATVLLFVDRGMSLLLGPVRALGTIALALLIFTGIVAALSAIIHLANDYAPYPVSLFNALGMYRPPVLSLMLLWAYLGTTAAFGTDVHRARLAPSPLPAASSAARNGLTLDASFANWLDDRCLRADQGTTIPATDRPTIPIIFVAAEGGGIRAASWTAYVLRSAFGAEQEFASLCPDAAGMGRSDFLFALSGISGGSVGIATHTAYLLDPNRPAPPPPTATPAAAPTCPADDPRQCSGAWVETALGADHLAPAVTWLFTLEFPRLFLPVAIDADRAAALERSVEQGWAAAGLGDPRLFFSLCPQSATATAPCTGTAAHGRWDRTNPAIPLLLLNATSVESGCRFVATPLETNGRSYKEPVARCIAPLARDPQANQGTSTPPSASPFPHGILGATTDLVDLLCEDQDMPLSTAAFLSARWPYISPTGNIEGCQEVFPQGSGASGQPGQGYRPQTYLVDGGYLEGSGNATILSLYEALLPAIREYNAAANSRAVLLPVLLTIGNGYTEPSGPDLLQAPPQLTAPPATFGRIMNATSAVATQGADLRFTACDIFPATSGQPAATCADRFDATCAAVGPTICTPQLQGAIDTRCPNEVAATCILRHARFALLAHPGPRAELGWTLSHVAFADFAEQYSHLCGDTGSPGLIIDSWFLGLPRLDTPLRTTCTPATQRK